MGLVLRLPAASMSATKSPGGGWLSPAKSLMGRARARLVWATLSKCGRFCGRCVRTYLGIPSGYVES